MVSSMTSFDIDTYTEYNTQKVNEEFIKISSFLQRLLHNQNKPLLHAKKRELE